MMKYFLIIVCLSWFSLVHAEIRLPSIFSDHMVLQKSANVPVWGWAGVGEEVSVKLNGQTVTAITGQDKKWQVELNLADSPQGPFEMTVSGSNTIVIKDVVVGEVWLASGQSNMGYPMWRTLLYSNEVTHAANPMIREFWGRQKASFGTDEEFDGFWVVSSSGSLAHFSALGYFFSKELVSALDVPVGIIKVHWGGNRIEPFISASGFSSSPELLAEMNNSMEFVSKSEKDYLDWLAATGREDRPIKNPNYFTAGAASTNDGWVHVPDTGTVSHPDIPQNGAIWFRKQVILPAEKQYVPQVITLGPHAMFDKVYFNGTLVEETPVKYYQGNKNMRQFAIPGSLIHSGINELAYRIFAPSLPPGFSWAPYIGDVTLSGGWLARAEYTLPPVETVKPAPPPLAPKFRFPSAVFNGRVGPVVPYAIRGFIWYQGEANSRDGNSYKTLFPLLIKDWRNHWGRNDLPFYFCQLANYGDKPKSAGEEGRGFPVVREGQLLALSLPYTGMAVLIDTGESEDIHPNSKDVAGVRLAKIALSNTYGKSIPYSGPIYKSMNVEGSKIRIHFRYLEGGLVAKEVPATYAVMLSNNTTAPFVRNSPDSELEGFAICGDDNNWVWADAKIDPSTSSWRAGETVLVWSDKVPAPVAVRYAWAENPTGNLYNKADLPASPFRTDDYTVKTEQDRIQSQ